MDLLLQLATLSDAPAHPAWLGPDEQARLAGITDATRAAQFVAGHCLARQLAAEAAGGSATEWRFCVDTDGRRWLEHARLAPVYTSISHSRSALAVAVGPSALGVDFETTGRARDWQALAGALFSPEEARHLAAAPEAGREAAFLTLWTLKEAWAKRSGRGLQRQTARRCTARPCDPGDAEAWTWSLPDGGLLALAASAGARVHLRGVAGAGQPWRYLESPD
jgi:4'-phosphopantetheinyl transferase